MYTKSRGRWKAMALLLLVLAIALFGTGWAEMPPVTDWRGLLVWAETQPGIIAILGFLSVAITYIPAFAKWFEIQQTLVRRLVFAALLVGIAELAFAVKVLVGIEIFSYDQMWAVGAIAATAGFAGATIARGVQEVLDQRKIP